MDEIIAKHKWKGWDWALGACALVFSVRSECERGLLAFDGCHSDEPQLSSPSSLNMSNTKNSVSGDLGVHSGEELQLTTTITHVDAPTEIYKLTRKEAQE